VSRVDVAGTWAPESASSEFQLPCLMVVMFVKSGNLSVLGFLLVNRR